MKEHLKIISEFDQLPLDVIVMSPSHPRGIVQISHGMCEHKERYFDFMNFLCQNGYVCLIHDHRGHGKSIRCDDDLGYFYENGDQGVVEDLHQLTLWIRQQYPQLPLYLFGHSMGSLIVRCYCQKYDQDINGLFVCGSPSHNPLAGVGISLSHVYQKVKNDHYRPQMIQKIGFDTLNKSLIRRFLTVGYVAIKMLSKHIIKIHYVALLLLPMVLKHYSVWYKEPIKIMVGK